MKEDTRLNEWFVPKFGSLKFRLACGLLFLPYTGMCISFVIDGALIYKDLSLERLIAICIIYFLALGIAAHVADNIGSKKKKPWGNILTRSQSWTIIISCLTLSYLIGIYYIIYFTPLLIIIGIIEGFFLFAYNFELFDGLFHNNFWFSVSWGMLPFLAGHIIQSNSISSNAILISLLPFFLSYSEIKISRVYKEYKRNNQNIRGALAYERLLKILTLGTISVTCIFLYIKLSYAPNW